MHWERLLDRTYATLARSRLVTRGAVRARGIATAVIAKRLAPSTLPEVNGELRLAARLAPTIRVAVDVGANIGDWSRMALHTFPNLERLIAYEPGSVEAELRARLGGDPRATVVEAAVSDHTGSLTFYEAAADTKLSSAAAPPERLGQARTVSCVRLDDELPRLGLEHVDYLKIDVEGLDLHVLRGAERSLAERRISALQYEYGPLWQEAGSTLRVAHGLLSAAGYRSFLITPAGLREFPLGAVSELYMYANFVALLPETAARFEAEIEPAW